MPYFRLKLILLVVLPLVACAANIPVSTRISNKAPSPAYRSAVPLKTPSPATAIVTTARDMLGVPYRYGGSSPNGFDCSGLAVYVYRQAGIFIPRSSVDQYRHARKVPLNRLMPGDLLFFRLSPPKISHVAIYNGDGRFIHATSTGKYVSFASLDDPYWKEHLIAAGRFR